MKWLFLLAGLVLGGMMGVAVMCCCFVSSEASRQEEKILEMKQEILNDESEHESCT